jgi:glycosyltransferase involved in cell wall biosynthesis
LLYPTQLDGVASAHSSAVASKTCVFHDFVPVSQLSPSKKIPQTILFVGYPWYLKGVDVLIDAFLGLANDFPDAVLKIVGYCPDDRPWRERARYHARVEFLRPMPNVKVAELMSASQIFVLPSRTEAMGRVLLEAMASRSAIVASRVDGIPHYVRDGVDGLLAEPENAPDLEGKLRQLLADPAFAKCRAIEVAPGPQVQDEASLEAYIRASASTVHHPTSTCRMGRGEDSVVDAQLRVHGIEGLRVIDASVFPNIIGGNTNAPVVMVAEKAADLLRGIAPPAPAPI